MLTRGWGESALPRCICFYMLPMEVVKNMRSCSAIREWIGAAVFRVVQLMLSFTIISTPSWSFSVCVVAAATHWDLFFSVQQPSWFKSGKKTCSFVFSWPRCSVISAITLAHIFTCTFADRFSFFISLSLSTLLYFPFSLSSLAYHCLYSLDSPYTTAKITGAWLFPYVGFYYWFPATLMWILSTLHVCIDVWEK